MDGTVLNVAATIGAAILGAIIAGGAAVASVLLSAKKSRELEQEKERQEVSNLRKALLTEIDTLMLRYMDGMGKMLEAHPSNEPLAIVYPAYQRYFVVFEENAHLIGKIPDDRERELIVGCYNAAKGLLDSYRLNNSMTEKWNYAAGLGPAVLGQNYKAVASEVLRMMKEYVPVLKGLHAEALDLYHQLRTSLSKDLPR